MALGVALVKAGGLVSDAVDTAVPALHIAFQRFALVRKPQRKLRRVTDGDRRMGMQAVSGESCCYLFLML
jgi:hypothetical protein